MFGLLNTLRATGGVADVAAILAAPGAGTYGTDVNFVIQSQEKNNLNFTGCLDRKA